MVRHISADQEGLRLKLSALLVTAIASISGARWLAFLGERLQQETLLAISSQGLA